MKVLKALTLIAFMACVATASAQHGHGNCGNCPHHQQHQAKSTELQYNADGVETTILTAFPEAKNAKPQAKWTEVYNADRKLIGYAVYSKPASDGIKGFGGETPVMIALNPDKVIVGVYLLPNAETPKFVQHVQESGFFNNWNGLTLKEAKKKKVDTVSGATYTSRAVALSVQAALEKL